MIIATAIAGFIVGLFLYIIGLVTPGVWISIWVIPTLVIALPLIVVASIRKGGD